MKVRVITFLILCILVFASACSAVAPTQDMPTGAAVTQDAVSTSIPLTPHREFLSGRRRSAAVQCYYFWRR